MQYSLDMKTVVAVDEELLSQVKHELARNLREQDAGTAGVSVRTLNLQRDLHEALKLKEPCDCCFEHPCICIFLHPTRACEEPPS